MLLTKQFRPEHYEQALESWQWIADLRGKTPIMASLFGAVFLQDESGYRWLDPISGVFEQVASDRTSLQTALDTESGQDSLLLGALAMAAERRGLHLDTGEICFFMPPPALGGTFEVDHIEAGDFVVQVNLAGQLHEQIQDLPVGTRISGIEIRNDR